jgi:hypothetical protein
MSQNPYSRLKEAVQKWACKVMCPRTRHLYTLDNAKNGGSWKMSDIYEATRAADLCDYDVIVIAKDSSLVFTLRQRPGDAPWEVRA